MGAPRSDKRRPAGRTDPQPESRGPGWRWGWLEGGEGGGVVTMCELVVLDSHTTHIELSKACVNMFAQAVSNSLRVNFVIVFFVAVT